MGTLATRAPLGARAARSVKAERYFYSAASALMLVLVYLGFHHFYNQGRAYPGRDLTPPIRTLLILHGVAMTLWMILFLTQPLLAATRNLRLHRRLGSLGGLLAVALVLLGWRLGIAAARVAPPGLRIWGLTWPQFLIVPLGSITVFAAFIGTGLAMRRRPAIHRPMMLLGTLAALSAAIGRIDAVNALYAGTFWDRVCGPFFGTLVLGALFLLARCLLIRSLDRPFAAGYAALAVVFTAMFQFATSEPWAAIARFLIG